MAMQALVVASLVVAEKIPADKTEVHVVVHRGDGRQFRLRTDRCRPFWLLNFGGRSVDAIKELFTVGSTITVDLQYIASRWQTEAGGYQRGDMAADPKTIKAVRSPELRRVRAPDGTGTWEQNDRVRA